MSQIRIERLSEANFGDYETLTACKKDGGCYCALCHQKRASMADWQTRRGRGRAGASAMLVSSTQGPLAEQRGI